MKFYENLQFPITVAFTSALMTTELYKKLINSDLLQNKIPQ